MIEKQFKLLTIIFLAIFIVFAISQKSYAASDLTNTTKAYFCSEITQNYGNGDCILLENYDSNGNKTYGLIDTGRKISTINNQGENSTIVNAFLKNHGVTELEFMALRVTIT